MPEQGAKQFVATRRSRTGGTEKSRIEETRDETLDKWITASKGELLGPDGLLKQLSKRLLEGLREGWLTTRDIRDHIRQDQLAAAAPLPGSSTQERTRTEPAFAQNR